MSYRLTLSFALSFAGLSACGGADPAPGAGVPALDAGSGAEDAGPGPAHDAGAGDGAQPSPDAGPAEGRDGGSDPDAALPDSPHAPPTQAGLDYFQDLDDSLRDQALVAALHTQLAGDHDGLSYDDLFDAYRDVDGGRDGCADIFDFYSQQCWTANDACGEYMREGDCVNREHAWPKSWWGGASSPDQHQDLVSVLPTDGYVNGVRGNLPLGEITGADYTSTNGSQRGACATPGAPSGALCFEPTDTLKGDFARIYFYEAVRYEGEFGCCDDEAVSGADIKPWLEAQLRLWHEADPVDIAERTRNERLFAWQKNRNPFVDLPHLVARIGDF